MWCSVIPYMLLSPILYTGMTQGINLLNYSNNLAVYEYIDHSQSIAINSMDPKLQMNYRAKDIYGNEYDLQEILNSGKHLLIDFSVVWCAPCWSIHKSGILEEIQEKYKDDILVLWVEAEGANLSAIQGKENSTGGKPSRGDWIDEGKSIIPIISDKNMMTSLGVADDGYPTLAFIDLNGRYKIVNSELKHFDQVMAQSLKRDKNPLILSVDQPNPIAYFPAQFAVKYKSMGDHPKITWNFEGVGEYEGEQVEVIFKNSGLVKYTLTIDDTPYKTVYNGKVRVGTTTLISQLPYKEDFENPQGYNSLDLDNDGYGWMMLNRIEKNGIANLPQELLSTFSHSGKNSMISWSAIPQNDNGVLAKEKALTTNDWLISPQIQIPNDGNEYVLSFYGASASEGRDMDQISVWVSTTGVTPKDFSQKLIDDTILEPDKESANIWRKYSASLKKFAGEKIFIAFKHEDKNRMAALIDDITIKNTNDTHSKELHNKSPFAVIQCNGKIIVEGKSTIRVRLIDISGKIIVESEGKNEVSISTINLPQSVYILEISNCDAENYQYKIIL